MASETANSLNPVIRALLIGAVLIALVALPAFIDSYTLRVATGALMWAGLACAWNIVGGYAGYISFGHSAFFGIGAYTTAILMQSGIGASFFVTLLPAIALSIAVAVAIGGPTMRLRGAYFAIATWAFAEMLMQLVTVLDFTGGTAGLSLPAYLNEFFFYYVMLLAAAGSFLGVWLLIEHSRFGFRIKALRDDEPAAESLGIRTNLVKVQSFALSAAITAMFGSVYAYWTTFIDPHSVMGPQITDQMVVMVLLGGLGTIWGPALGGVLLWITNRYIWSTFGDTVIYLPILGIIIALVVLFLPNGLISLIVGRQRGKELVSNILRKF